MGLGLGCVQRGGSLQGSLVALIEDSPVLTERTGAHSFVLRGGLTLSLVQIRSVVMGSDLCYSDGAGPEQQGFLIMTAQELDVA